MKKRLPHLRRFGYWAGLSLVFSIFIFPSALHAARGAVQGQVLHAQNRQAQAGVTVELWLNSQVVATQATDQQGRFQFEGIWPGTYAVKAHWLGNAEVMEKGVVVGLGETVQLTLLLPPLEAPAPAPGPEVEVLPPPSITPPPADEEVVVYDIAEVEVVEEEAMEVEYLAAPPPPRQMLLPSMKEASVNHYFVGKAAVTDPVATREGYDFEQENTFIETADEATSTFSIDVDAASYSNARRFLLREQRMPPVAAVRTEEMINYFSYDYPEPKGNRPFAVQTEVSECPWNPKNKLVHIGLQGKKIATEDLPANNLVFLLDVSGSMAASNKLGLVKQGMNILIDQLRPQDRVAIVVYAGAAGLVLPSTSGRDKAAMRQAIQQLRSGGSTAGGAGIELAYKVALQNLRPKGNNRVILCTDGDFNVGVSSSQGLEKLIENKRRTGIFLTVLGFGTGNLQDAKMEKLADVGNGNYAYIDQEKEARKVFVQEMGGTLTTIAKDVKLQLTFHKEKVKAYRLIGYENRKLENKDFDDDKKDAGELGAGHTVTALYEVVPAGGQPESDATSDGKFQTRPTKKGLDRNELLTVRLRYKAPDADVSKLIEVSLPDRQIALPQSSVNFRFSAAVAAFGMLLRNSQYTMGYSYADVASLARAAMGPDANGYRAEFLKMVAAADRISKQVNAAAK